MNKSTRLLITAAAMTGLYAGAFALRASAATIAGHSISDDQKSATKHDCKGKNACKGQGGCKSSDNGCKGQNSCKGNGGCSTADQSDTKK